MKKICQECKSPLFNAEDKDGKCYLCINKECILYGIKARFKDIEYKKLIQLELRFKDVS